MSSNTLLHSNWCHVRFFSRLWRINVQVFTLCWSVTDTSMNTWIMVIGQPVEGSGSFKNQQSTTISSHSMLLRFHWYQYESGSIMIFHETSLQFLEKTDIWFHFERIPLRISNPWFAMRSLWSTSLNIIVPTNMPSAFWMEHFVKKLLQWLNLDTSHSPSWNWKSIFQTDIMQLHGRIFPKYKWLESYVRLVWLDILRCQGHLPNFHCFFPIWHISSKRFSAFTLVFLNKTIRVAVEQHDANEGR